MSMLRAGTPHLSDEEFADQFESCRLPASSFHYADHIRLAWIYVRGSYEAETATRMAESIQRFAAHNGVAGKYDHTMTGAFIPLVAVARVRPAEWMLERQLRSALVRPTQGT